MTGAPASVTTHSTTVVPRWEWRTFGGLGDAERTIAALPGGGVETSVETYVLSWAGDASVKVRAGAMDTKMLRRVDGAGLQLWVPVLKATFPLAPAAVATTFSALGVPTPDLDRPGYTRADLERDLIAPRADLHPAVVRKQRRRALLDGCMVEFTVFVVDGTPIDTVAVESPDPALVLATVERLGLTGRRNTCVARGLKQLLGWGPPRYAVIDVGTNSVKFHLGERIAGGTRTLTDRAVVTRLGEGLAETGGLTAPAMERTADAVTAMAAEARRDGPADIVSVGTAGLRQAPNRDAFLQTVFDRCGVTVEVISGPEEARLAYLAAVSTLPTTGGQRLVFDSGGGSSQFTFGSGDRPQEQFSLDVGAVRFTERYGLAGAVDENTLRAALDGIADDLGDLAGRPRPDGVVGIGGTSTNLAAVRHGLARYDPDVVHGTVLDLAEIDRQIETYRVRTAQQRREEIVGLQPARAEVILAGACIVRTILTLTGQDALTVSDRGLRHGVVAERFGS